MQISKKNRICIKNDIFEETTYIFLLKLCCVFNCKQQEELIEEYHEELENYQEEIEVLKRGNLELKSNFDKVAQDYTDLLIECEKLFEKNEDFKEKNIELRVE